MASKRWMLGLAAALVMANATASAQGPMQGQMQKLAQTTPEERAKVQTTAMTEKLGLTEQQVPAVAQINLGIAKQMQPIIQGGDGPLMKLREAKAIEAQRDAELQKVLLPPQYQQWLAEKEAIKQKAEEKLMEKHAGSES